MVSTNQQDDRQAAGVPAIPLRLWRALRSRRKALLAGLLLFALAVSAYLPATQSGFIWDDDDYVQQNRLLRSLAGLRRIWFEPTATPQYYPLVHTTYWLEYHLWGLEPAGYHVVNILLHAMCAVLAWRVLRSLQVPGAWVAAAVFAVHPVHVESVAWITERKNVLSGVFYLGAALAYVRYALPERGKPDAGPRRYGSRWLYAASLALFVLALLSKTVACSLPAAALLVLWWKRGRPKWQDVRDLAPFFVVGIALGLVTVWLERHQVGAAGREWSLSAVERVLIAGRALWFYAGKLAWPAELTFTYPRWEVNPAVWWQYAFPASAVACVVALALARRRIGRGPLVGVLFFAGTLVPALGFFDVYPMRFSFVADHFQYLASLGLIALAVAAVSSAAERLGRPPGIAAAVAAAGVLAALGILTWQQTHIYRGPETLWRDTLRKNPQAWLAHNNLGNIVLNRGKTEEAIAHYREALSLGSNLPETHSNLCLALQRQGKLDRAVAHGRRALQLKPDFAAAHNNLGLALQGQYRITEAAGRFRETLRLDPHHAKARANLWNALRVEARLAEAVERHRLELEADARDVEALTNLGLGLVALGKPEPGAVHLRAAIEIKPDHAPAHHALGLALKARGKLDEAVRQFREALRCQPDHQEARKHLEGTLWLLSPEGRRLGSEREAVPAAPG
ncbi:MAG: tetratricopeptide repeat protein [Candidatus Brocadiia bacterium]